jgi:hypothetical protein
MPDLESMSLLTKWLLFIGTLLVAMAVAEAIMYWRGGR